MDIEIKKARHLFGFGLQTADGGSRFAIRDPRQNMYWPEVRIRGIGLALIQGYAPEATVFGTASEVVLMTQKVHEFTFETSGLEFPIRSVITHDSTRGTVQNMAATLKRLKLLPDEVYFITHRYHCKRARLTLRKEAGVSAEITPAESFIAAQDPKGFRNWWKETYLADGIDEYYKRLRSEWRGIHKLNANDYEYIPKP